MNQGLDATVERVKGPDEELLDLLATQARRLPIAVFSVLALVGVVIYPYSRHAEYALWLTAVIGVLALRFLVLTRLPAWTELPLHTRVNIAAALSFLNGITHAACLYFFPDLADTERTIQSLVLAGLGTAAVATTAGHPKVYLAYFLPIFPTLIVLWATDGSWSMPTPTSLGLALSISVFSVVLVLLARDTSRQFNETITIRKEQEKLNAQLQQALHAADVADRAKTRFLAAASHDLRQPIHALSLFGAALKMQALPHAARELAENIEESINVLATQLDALLDISRLDAGAVKPDMGVLDLTGMLRRIGREFEPQLEDKGLDLVVRLVDNVHVRSDRLLLERVIRNLLNNAVRYTDKGSITIETRLTQSGCVLAIEDTGIGIPATEQQKIFGEFYQVSKESNEARQGLGLGLSIVTRLLALLESSLRLVSTPGEGTRVEISLMLEQGKPEEKEPRGMARLDGVRVLVIDDDRSVRMAMSVLLATFGAETATAATIDEALKCVAANAPDVVVSDLRLEGESGIDAIARIRELVSNVPAILITGDTGPDQIRRANESGLELIHKPVNAVDLEKKISAVIHRT